jgi:hypothetical protein
VARQLCDLLRARAAAQLALKEFDRREQAMVIAEAERGREDRYAALLSRWRTSEVQASPKDVPAALARWEPPQVALGKYLR